MVRSRLGTAAAWTSEITLTVLFFLVPLFFWSATSELFEFDKMLLVYLGAGILLTSETVRILNLPKPRIIRPKLLIPGLIFLLAMGLATIFSIDTHVSLFGYFDRFNGGLLSWLAYAVIYFALVQQEKERLEDLLRVNFASGLIVAIWGISEHFGHSPSCFLLTHSFDDNCWVESVKDRVFATLGQPNWMAAYLAMLFPLGLAKYLQTKKRVLGLGWFVWLILIFLGFVFTYSRGGSIGLGIALVAFLVLLGRKKIKTYLKLLIPLVLTLAVLTVIFATPLTEHIFGSEPARGIGTTVELGNDSGSTRLVVWQGAWDIFTHHPLLGTGLETFGESFYNFRPVAMNQTSEWDFLFNKAHNEYLNYLATTGLIGTTAYLLLLAWFFYLGFRSIRRGLTETLTTTAALASVLGYLAQNVFGFTVVPLAMLFIFDLAVLNWDHEDLWKPKLPKFWNKLRLFHLELLVLILTLAILMEGVSIWRANVAYADGLGSLSIGDSEGARLELTQATSLDPWEPNYQIELAQALANLAQTAGPGDSGRALADRAKAWADRAVTISPDNLFLWRERGSLLEKLIKIDSQYRNLAEAAHLKAVAIAPTEPKVAKELADFYQSQNDLAAASKYYRQASQLKPGWLDPLIPLIKLEIEQGNLAQAKIDLTQARALSPHDPEVVSLSQKVGL